MAAEGLTLTQALGARDGEVIALVGGGGKTTALYRLLAEAAAGGALAVGATTTRMWPPPPGTVDALVETDDLEAARAALAARGAGRVLVARPRAADGKLVGVPPDWIPALRTGARLVVVEADGAAGRPIKAPAAHEPALPAGLDLLVATVGADAVGAPLGPGVAHRHEALAAQGGLAVGRPLLPGEPLAPEAIAAALLHPRGNLRRLPPGGRVVPLVTRLAAGRHADAAASLARALLARGARRVVSGDLGGAVGPAGPLGVLCAPPSRVAGVILAAGRGERMGAGPPKPLRPLLGRPLLAHVLDAAVVSGLAEVVVVLGHGADEVGALVETVARRQPGAAGRLRAVVNARHAEGQGTSVAAGAAAAPAGATGALFLLADQPLVRAPLLDRLLAEHRQYPDRAIVPCCDGRQGNPVLFPSALLPALARLSGERGGRALLERAPERVARVETGDPAILTDLDTEADLRALEADLSLP
jgi:probable selenium-dependent hydroxylase accessory protein YqeC